MKRSMTCVGTALCFSYVLFCACTSSDTGGGGDEAGGDGGGASGGGGEAGESGSGGSASGGKGGVSPSGSGGSGGKLAVDAGANDPKLDAADAKDTGKDSAGTKVSYECSAFIGPNVTGEWFAAGFETLVNGDKWQVKAPHRSFVEDWANPNHAVWKESACEGTFSDCPTKSKCAGGKSPDRIIFVTQTGNYLGTSQQKWQDLITSAIPTLKAKFPGLKNIELSTFVRGPGNKDCGNETTVSPNLDKAQRALADASQGFITVSPRFEVTTCAHFGSAPHFTNDGNKAVAQTVGKHYAAQEK